MLSLSHGALRSSSAWATRRIATSSKPAVLLASVPSQERLLRQKAQPVTWADIANSDDIRKAARELQTALQDFRDTHGFGRAIAAPQIGHHLRMIALNLGEEWNLRTAGTRGPFTIYNPEITRADTATFTMWDDCMSFPDAMYLVRRHKHVSMKYDILATAGKLEGQVETRIWEKMPQEFAELVQHEIDHLDGVLMSDRAVENSQPISRQDYEQNRYKYDAMVDYVIQPTS